MNHYTPLLWIVALLIVALLIVALLISVWLGYRAGRTASFGFCGKRVLISFFTGVLVSLVFIGQQRLIDGQIQPLIGLWTLGFFVLMGITAEVTVWMNVKRKQGGSRYNSGP
jgi:hypothetical protein